MVIKKSTHPLKLFDKKCIQVKFCQIFFNLLCNIETQQNSCNKQMETFEVAKNNKKIKKKNLGCISVLTKGYLQYIFSIFPGSYVLQIYMAHNKHVTKGLLWLRAEPFTMGHVTLLGIVYQITFKLLRISNYNPLVIIYVLLINLNKNQLFL